MKIDQFLKHHGIAGPTRSARRTRRPTRSSSAAASRRSTTPPGTSSSAARPTPRPPSSSARRGAARPPSGSRSTRSWRPTTPSIPSSRVFVISYDDFNPFLDHFRDAVQGAGTAGEALERWKLQDHMDAILALGVTKLVDSLTAEKVDLTALTRGPAPRPPAPGGALRPVDPRADREALEPAPPAVRLPLRSGAVRDLQIGFGTTLAVIALIATFPGNYSGR